VSALGNDEGSSERGVLLLSCSDQPGNTFRGDFIAVQRQITTELVEAGCMYLKIDGSGRTAYADPSWIANVRGRGLDPIAVLLHWAAADATAMEGFEGFTLGIHFCRDDRTSRVLRRTAIGAQGSSSWWCRPS
jgi:hypothetical protein